MHAHAYFARTGFARGGAIDELQVVECCGTAQGDHFHYNDSLGMDGAMLVANLVVGRPMSWLN